MWLGLVYLPSLDDEVILCAWRPGRGRPFTVAGTRGSAADMARALRVANGEGGHAFVMPRCDHCGTPLDLPEL